MQRFMSAGQPQGFLSAYGSIASHCDRGAASGAAYCPEMRQRFQFWRKVTALAPAVYALIKMRGSTGRPGDSIEAR
jgi:hypothetical protein